jgi:CDP-paratose 2-epimerase
MVIVTGSAGLIGSEAMRHFKDQGVIGVDNNMRYVFFGPEGSNDNPNRDFQFDIRDQGRIDALFRNHGNSLKMVIHTAGQPSHDWAAKNPRLDFDVNAVGTLNLLEATRKYAPSAVFIYTSTNKVYGDRPNQLPLIEAPKRWGITPLHPYALGISEGMSVDHTLHSLFGVSKLSADLMVQEYGNYYGMKTVCFRCGCITGPNHNGVEQHGFLSYLMRCAVTKKPYTIYGFQGKQVRDNLHVKDLIKAFDAFYKAPRVGQVYNMGGGWTSNCSVLEALDWASMIVGRTIPIEIGEERIGDHKWWITDTSKFECHYPDWKVDHTVPMILQEIFERWNGLNT